MIPSFVAIGSPVTGLEPDTVYRYSLGDGTPSGGGPGKPSKPARIGQVTYGSFISETLRRDSRAGGDCSSAAYRRHPDLDFIVLAGDLVDRGNERTNWDHFFLRADGVFDRVPLMPCVGNHEYLDMGPRLYRAFFELPRNGPDGIDSDLVYHFECGDACFAVLDSTLAVCDPAERETAGGLARRHARADQGFLEVRDLPPPDLPLPSLARYAGLARALGADLRQAPRRSRPARTRPRLSADVPPPRTSASRRSPATERSI